MGVEVEKRIQTDGLYTDVLLEEKPAIASNKIADYNKQKNHFSKSTADSHEESLNVRDLENLFGMHHKNSVLLKNRFSSDVEQF